jgi:hypothetical protein
MKLGILTCHDKVQMLDKGYNSESNIIEIMPLFVEAFLIDKHL